MSSYLILVSLHVVTAVLGIGQIAALAGLCSQGVTDASTLLAIVRPMKWSFLIMLLTGGILVVLTGEAFLGARWLWLAFALSVLLGLLQVSVKRQLQSTVTNNGATSSVWSVGVMAWIMSALVAAIVFLMVTKPW
jgi:hypothetical protein